MEGQRGPSSQRQATLASESRLLATPPDWKATMRARFFTSGKEQRARVLERYRLSGSPSAAAMDWSVYDKENRGAAEVSWSESEPGDVEAEMQVALEEEAAATAYEEWLACRSNVACPMCWKGWLRKEAKEGEEEWRLSCDGCGSWVEGEDALEAGAVGEGVEAVEREHAESGDCPGRFVFFPRWSAAHKRRLTAACPSCHLTRTVL